MRAATGIKALDKGLEGGFPRPCGILLFSEIIAEKRIFAEQFIRTGLQQGEVCLYVDFFRAPQFVRNQFAKFGEFPLDKLLLVDTTSAQVMLPSKEEFQIRDLTSLVEILNSLEAVLQKKKPSRVVLDSLDFLTERFDKGQVLAFLMELVSAAKGVGAVIGLLFVNWSYSEGDLRGVLAHADFVLEFQTSFEGGAVENRMRLKGRDDGGLVTNWIPFNMDEFVGLVVHFPRVLVTGPHNAGKSTVVQALSETAVSIDRMGTTIAFDYGSLDISGVAVELLGTPGQERFEFIFKIFAREVNGILLVVDSTRPEDLPRAKEMRRLAGEQFPLVVLANKRDLPGAMPLDQIKAGLELEERVPIVETVATEGSRLKEALEKLTELIIWGWQDA